MLIQILFKGLSWHKYRSIKRYLSNRGIDFLASVRQILAESKTREIKTPLIISKISIQEKGNEEEKTCLYVSSFEDQLVEVWHKLLASNEIADDERFGGTIWVGISGDQGGGTTKLTLHFLNVSKPNSVHNLHIIGT